MMKLMAGSQMMSVVGRRGRVRTTDVCWGGGERDEGVGGRNRVSITAGF